MKVSSTELPPRQVSLEIEVEKDRLDRAMDDAYRRLAGRVEVPGFRRGKAPRSMVERMIGHDRIVEEALDHLVPEVVSEAMEQEKVEPFTRPRVESIEFDPLRLKAVVGLAPKVELGDYKGVLRIDREEPQVGDTEIEGVIQRVRESYAQWAPVERAVKLSDRVGIDLKVTPEGHEQPLIDSKDAEYVVDPEGAQPAPGFAEQLIGMNPDETKSFQLNMPEDYRDKDVAGKPAQFEVVMHWVKERELPELDDTFAQQVGDYADVAALRTAVEAQLRHSEDERVRDKVEEDSLNKLVEISSIEFPPQLVEYQAQTMLENFKSNVERQGLQLNQYLRLVGKEQDTFEQEIREQAETRVRRSLALDAFAEAEQIGAEQETSEDASESRSLKALARLVELATGDARNGGQKSDEEKTAERAKTSDTGRQASDSDVPATPVGEEERGTT
ncbi:MAG: trigger factor [Chloroflexi bacterium]|nr:trigger factor [Chloroflexota bacterium]MBV9896676.1 trigger factor [Chloroflexota bacterium]